MSNTNSNFEWNNDSFLRSLNIDLATETDDGSFWIRAEEAFHRSRYQSLSNNVMTNATDEQNNSNSSTPSVEELEAMMNEMIAEDGIAVDSVQPINIENNTGDDIIVTVNSATYESTILRIPREEDHAIEVIDPDNVLSEDVVEQMENEVEEITLEQFSAEFLESLSEEDRNSRLARVMRTEIEAGIQNPPINFTEELGYDGDYTPEDEETSHINSFEEEVFEFDSEGVPIVENVLDGNISDLYPNLLAGVNDLGRNKWYENERFCLWLSLVISSSNRPDIYNLVLLKKIEVLDRLFGRDYWDICLKVVDDILSYDIIIHFPEIMMTNSDEMTHRISDLYVKLKYGKHGVGHFIESSIQGCRGSVSKEEFVSQYMHSHLSSVNYSAIRSDEISYYSFCLGDNGNLNITLESINRDIEHFDILDFESFLYELDAYVRWESLEGVPYKRFGNISINGTDDVIPINTRENSNQITRFFNDLKDCILDHKHFLDLKILPSGKYEIVYTDEFNSYIVKYIEDNFTTYSRRQYLCKRGPDGKFYKLESNIASRSFNFNSDLHVKFKGENRSFEITDIGEDDQMSNENNYITYIIPQYVAAIKKVTSYEINKKILESSKFTSTKANLSNT